MNERSNMAGAKYQGRSAVNMPNHQIQHIRAFRGIGARNHYTPFPSTRSLDSAVVGETSENTATHIQSKSSLLWKGQYTSSFLASQVRCFISILEKITFKLTYSVFQRLQCVPRIRNYHKDYDNDSRDYLQYRHKAIKSSNDMYRRVGVILLTSVVRNAVMRNVRFALYALRCNLMAIIRHSLGINNLSEGFIYDTVNTGQVVFPSYHNTTLPNRLLGESDLSLLNVLKRTPMSCLPSERVPVSISQLRRRLRITQSEVEAAIISARATVDGLTNNDGSASRRYTPTEPYKNAQIGWDGDTQNDLCSPDQNVEISQSSQSCNDDTTDDCRIWNACGNNNPSHLTKREMKFHQQEGEQENSMDLYNLNDGRHNESNTRTKLPQWVESNKSKTLVSGKYLVRDSNDGSNEGVSSTNNSVEITRENSVFNDTMKTENVLLTPEIPLAAMPYNIVNNISSGLHEKADSYPNLPIAPECNIHPIAIYDTASPNTAENDVE